MIHGAAGPTRRNAAEKSCTLKRRKSVAPLAQSRLRLPTPISENTTHRQRFGIARHRSNSRFGSARQLRTGFGS